MKKQERREQRLRGTGYGKLVTQRQEHYRTCSFCSFDHKCEKYDLLTMAMERIWEDSK